MKKLMGLLIVLCILLSSCASNNPAGSKSEESSKTITNTSNDNAITDIDITEYSWKKEVAQKLLYEFYDFYNNMEKNDLIRPADETIDSYKYNADNKRIMLNRTMAADRCSALIDVYRDYITTEELEDVKSKAKNVDNGGSWFSRVFHGYSDTGLHIIALSERTMNDSYFYKPLCDKLRGDNNESALFEEMQKNVGYYLTDVFMEDLSGRRTNIKARIELAYVDGLNLSLIPKIFQLPAKGEVIFKKYNRRLTENGEVYENESWNLLASKSQVDAILVTIDDEKILVIAGIPLEGTFYSNPIRQKISRK